MPLVIDGVKTQFPDSAVVTRRADRSIREISTASGTFLWNDDHGSFQEIFGGLPKVEASVPEPTEPTVEAHSLRPPFRHCLDCAKEIRNGILCMSCAGKRGAIKKREKKEEALAQAITPGTDVDTSDNVNNASMDTDKDTEIPDRNVSTEEEFSGAKIPDAVPQMRQDTEHTPDVTVRHSELQENFPEEKRMDKLTDTDSTKPLPNGAVSAIRIMLANAGYQLMQTEKKELVEYMQGMSFGVSAAAAIICGALGYDAGFLVEEEKDAEKPSTNR